MGLELYPSWVSVAEAFLVKAQHSLLQPSQVNQTQTSPSPPSQKSTLVAVVVGLSLARLLDRTVGKLGLGRLQRFAALGVGDTECCSVERLGVDDDAAFDRVPYGLFG